MFNMNHVKLHVLVNALRLILKTTITKNRRSLLLHKLGLPPCFLVTDMVSQIKSPSNCITFNLIDEEVEGLMDTAPAGCRARNLGYSGVGA
ncbi:hypothetical protein IMY05_001G0072800 [Salix suchowensis]|nr:hypothetical protein IMY05_001G0072800 [Salix suchowensis]